MKKLTSVLSVSALVVAAVGAAGVSAGKPVAKGHVNAPVVNDELMVSDPKNPRLLRSKRPGVIDRKWIERTAKPRIPAAVLDELEQVMPRKVGDQVLQSPEAPLVNAAFAPRIEGNVLVVSGDQLAGQTQNGIGFDHNNGSFSVINLVLQNLGDQYDFITVFTTFPDANVAAYYFPIKQDIDGLGACNFQQGDTFGCLFDQTEGQLEQLQGFVFMNDLTTWRDFDFNYDGFAHPFDDFDSSVFSTLGQEVAHRWGSGLRFVDPRSDDVSELLLGRDNSHWAAYVDTDASVMDGWDWADEEDGIFNLEGDMDTFSTLDLYTIGALPVAAAAPFFVIDDARFDVKGRDFIGIDGARIPADIVLQLPSDQLLDDNGMEIRATGERVPVTIQDVVDAEGNRCPDPDATQKTFKQAIVLVTRPGQSAEQAAGVITDLNTVLATWEEWWLDRTNRALRLCTALEEDCTHAELEITAGDIEHDGDSIQPGDTGKLSITVKATGRDAEDVVIKLEKRGDSADFYDVQETISVGDIDEGEEKTVTTDVDYADDYPCGATSIIKTTVTSSNAKDVVETIRVFPGLKVLEEQTFAKEDNGFGVNADEKDGTTRGRDGALRFENNVELTCDMTQRSAERDASPSDRGAFITGPGTDHVPDLLDDDEGEGAELDGDTSLWSPKFSLEGTQDPEFTFAYWFDGEEGDVLKIQISGDGEKSFITASEVTESFHGWVNGRVSIRDHFDELPESATIRFIFEGNGRLEGGIDDVRLLDFDGQCLEAARGFGLCGCDQNGDASPMAPVAVLVGLAALRRRRRNRSTGAIIDGDTTPVL